MDGSICAFEVFQTICLANSKTVQHSTEKQQRQIAELNFKYSVPNFLKNAVIRRNRTEGKNNFNSETGQRGGGESVSVPAVIFKFLLRKDHRPYGSPLFT